MTANELLKRIRDVACRKPDVIPPGWLSAKQWASLWKTSTFASRRALAIGVRGGVVERKRFLVKLNRTTALVSHFRPIEKKSGK